MSPADGTPAGDTRDRLRAIREAEPGPGTVAYFDYDGTVIDGYSAGAFYRKRLREFDVGPVEMVRTVLSGMRGIRTDDDFKEFLSITEDTSCERVVWEERDERLHTILFSDTLRTKYVKIVANSGEGTRYRTWFETIAHDPSQEWSLREAAAAIGPERCR